MISLFVIMSLSLSVGDEESPDLVSVLLQHLLKLMTWEINNPNTLYQHTKGKCTLFTVSRLIFCTWFLPSRYSQLSSLPLLNAWFLLTVIT